MCEGGKKHTRPDVYRMFVGLQIVVNDMGYRLKGTLRLL